MPLFRETENCMRATDIERGHLVADAGTYYAEIYKLLPKARSSVYILGWDFHSAISLLPREKNLDPPAELLPFLSAVTKKNPHLHIYILIWYSNLLYAHDREKLIQLRMMQQSYKNIHLVFDNDIPISASHHQKILVMDDTIAYCGGIDFTAGRWDLPEHKPDDPRRVKPNGALFGPYHDLDIRVQGKAASALGALFRMRWKNATGTELPIPPATDESFDELPWTLPAVPCAVSRTMPSYKSATGITETYKMYLALIAAAKRHLYIENQYLTSKSIAKALRARLREESGPFITIVLPRINPQGPGNKLLMMHRSVILWQMKKDDLYDRLRVYAPLAENGEQIYVHSKFMNVDDIYTIVGSSNLTARSMGLDSECDVTVDATGSAEARDALCTWKMALLAEHTGAPLEKIKTLCAEGADSLHRFIDERPKNGKRLERIVIKKPTSFAKAVYRMEICDYRRPFIFDSTIDALRKPLFRARHPLWRHSLVLLGTAIGLLFLVAILLNFTELQYWTARVLDSEALMSLRDIALGPVWMPLVFVVMGALCVPMNFLMLATATVFAPGWALLYIWSGMTLSAAVNYAIGYLLGRKTLRKLFAKNTERISAAMRKREFLSFAIVRMIPVAPFGIINYIAGAYHARFFHYLVGTFLGILPGSVLLVFFQRTLLTTIADPTPQNIFLLVVYSMILWGLAYFFRKRF